MKDKRSLYLFIKVLCREIIIVVMLGFCVIGVFCFIFMFLLRS